MNIFPLWRAQLRPKDHRCSLPDTLFHDNEQFSTTEGKADAFNKYFASTFRPIKQTSPSVPSTSYSQDNLESISVSTEEVSYLLSNLSTDKGTGPDDISARLLKECSNEIAPSMTLLFNKSLSLGKIPREWKEANVVPIRKKGDIHDQQLPTYFPALPGV